MDEQERDYLKQLIRQLDQSKGRWKLATITLAAALALFLTVSGGSSLVLMRRNAAMLQQALAEREMARAQAEQAARERKQVLAAIEMARVQAEQASREPKQMEKKDQGMKER
jgi:hypothetical protein